VRRAFPALLVLAACVGCAFEPEGAEPFTPPASYRVVWDSAQACTGRHGRFGALRFFVVPGDGFDTPDGREAGRTSGTTIYLSEAYVDHPMVVKHEMIHALGVHHHPAIPFETPCHATWASYHAAPGTRLVMDP